MTSQIKEMHAIVHGRVQGVGFRATVRHYAGKLGLTGTASNLQDGTVEIYAQGAEEQLRALIEMLKKDAGLGHVESVSTNFYSPIQKFDRFAIK